jgi:RimJ/RimL family protein N-acetyltransferase
VSISVSRERLEDGPTAIRPLESSDLPALVEARIRNREFLTEWEPTRDESFFTPAGQARELALDDAAWRTATGFPFAILEADAGDRLIGRVALANVVRGVWQNATLGYWVRTPAVAGTRRARSGWRCGSRSRSPACIACSPRSCPATCARGAWSRSAGSATRASRSST